MFWLSFVFIWSYKASVFPNINGYYCEYCLFCDEDSVSFSLFFVILKAVYVYLCIFLSSVFPILGVLGPWDFSGGPGHIFPVWDSAV